MTSSSSSGAVSAAAKPPNSIAAPKKPDPFEFLQEDEPMLPASSDSASSKQALKRPRETGSSQPGDRSSSESPSAKRVRRQTQESKAEISERGAVEYEESAFPDDEEEEEDGVRARSEPPTEQSRSRSTTPTRTPARSTTPNSGQARSKTPNSEKRTGRPVKTNKKGKKQIRDCITAPLANHSRAINEGGTLIPEVFQGNANLFPKTVTGTQNQPMRQAVLRVLSKWFTGYKVPGKHAFSMEEFSEYIVKKSDILAMLHREGVECSAEKLGVTMKIVLGLAFYPHLDEIKDKFALTRSEWAAKFDDAPFHPHWLGFQPRAIVDKFVSDSSKAFRLSTAALVPIEYRTDDKVYVCLPVSMATNDILTRVNVMGGKLQLHFMYHLALPPGVPADTVPSGEFNNALNYDHPLPQDADPKVIRKYLWNGAIVLEFPRVAATPLTGLTGKSIKTVSLGSAKPSSSASSKKKPSSASASSGSAPESPPAAPSTSLSASSRASPAASQAVYGSSVASPVPTFASSAGASFGKKSSASSSSSSAPANSSAMVDLTASPPRAPVPLSSKPTLSPDVLTPKAVRRASIAALTNAADSPAAAVSAQSSSSARELASRGFGATARKPADEDVDAAPMAIEEAPSASAHEKLHSFQFDSDVEMTSCSPAGRASSSSSASGGSQRNQKDNYSSGSLHLSLAPSMDAPSDEERDMSASFGLGLPEFRTTVKPSSASSPRAVVHKDENQAIANLINLPPMQNQRKGLAPLSMNGSSSLASATSSSSSTSKPSDIASSKVSALSLQDSAISMPAAGPEFDAEQSKLRQLLEQQMADKKLPAAATQGDGKDGDGSQKGEAGKDGKDSKDSKDSQYNKDSKDSKGSKNDGPEMCNVCRGPKGNDVNGVPHDHSDCELEAQQGKGAELDKDGPAAAFQAGESRTAEKKATVRKSSKRRKKTNADSDEGGTEAEAAAAEESAVARDPAAPSQKAKDNAARAAGKKSPSLGTAADHELDAAANDVRSDESSEGEEEEEDEVVVADLPEEKTGNCVLCGKPGPAFGTKDVPVADTVFECRNPDEYGCKRLNHISCAAQHNVRVINALKDPDRRVGCVSCTLCANDKCEVNRKFIANNRGIQRYRCITCKRQWHVSCMNGAQKCPLGHELCA